MNFFRIFYVLTLSLMVNFSFADDCDLNSDCSSTQHCNSQGLCEEFISVGQCSDSNICDAGEGDCDQDTNCEGNLECLQSDVIADYWCY